MNLKNYIVYPLESAFYNGVIRFLLRKKPKYTKKYRISICGIFKNEGRFLQEWIEYHLLIGIDHFFMYNNNSEDNYHEILQPYIDRGYITLVQWTKNYAQMEAYKHCVDQYGNETQWMSFLDIDEFIVPIKKNNINEWIKDYEKYPSILIYWKMFGTSGTMEHDFNKLVIEQYTICHDGFPTHRGKCIFNTDYPIVFYNELTHHNTTVRYHGFRVGPVNQFKRFILWKYHLSFLGESSPSIQINHYWSKAWDIYDQKRKMTDVFYANNPKRNFDYFLNNEILNVSVDYSIFRFLMYLKLRLKGEIEDLY